MLWPCEEKSVVKLFWWPNRSRINDSLTICKTNFIAHKNGRGKDTVLILNTSKIIFSLTILALQSSKSEGVWPRTRPPNHEILCCVAQNIYLGGGGVCLKITFFSGCAKQFLVEIMIAFNKIVKSMGGGISIGQGT